MPSKQRACERCGNVPSDTSAMRKYNGTAWTCMACLRHLPPQTRRECTRCRDVHEIAAMRPGNDHEHDSSLYCEPCYEITYPPRELIWAKARLARDRQLAAMVSGDSSDELAGMD